MGVFGTVEIMISCESKESAEKIFKELTDENVSEYIKENKDFDSFSFFSEDTSTDGTVVYVNLSSGRVQHAEWMGEMIRDFVIANFRDDVYEIQGEVNTPDNYLWWEKSEEE